MYLVNFVFYCCSCFFRFFIGGLFEIVKVYFLDVVFDIFEDVFEDVSGIVFFMLY